MLRITSSQQEGTTRIRLEGKLVGPWVAECRALCAGESARGQSLALDLRELRFADQEGIELLRELAGAGHIERSTGFAAELMRGGKGEVMDGKRSERERAAAGLEPASQDALLVSLRARRPGAFEELVRRHGGAMLATVQRFLPDEGESREALMESFRLASGGACPCASDADLARWLHRIAVDVCVRRLMSAPDPRAPIAELLPAFHPSGSHARPVPGWRVDGAAVDELRERVRRRIHELPAAHRVVLLLADGEELAPHEIAERLALPRKEVESRLHRARQALVTLLGPTVTSRAAG
jgi:RNA polymerase sigma-70 factor (ECF subfamily)